MQEQKVLAALVYSRAAYNTVLPYLDEADFSNKGRLILAEIGEYYTVDPVAPNVDPEIIAERIARALPNPKQADTFREIIRGLRPELSPENIALEYLQLKRHIAGNKLASALLVRSPREQIDGLLDEFAQLSRATDLNTEPKEVIERDLKRLMQAENDPTGKIRLLPSALNRRIAGGVRRGDCVIIFGRPNSGKSLFCINAVSGMLSDGLKVLWLENEERGNRTLARIAARLARVPLSEWMHNEDSNIAAAIDAGYNNLVYESLTPGTLSEIEELVVEHKPDVMVVNQMRNVLAKGESFTRTLDVVANRLRAMGKRHNVLTLQVTQAYSPPPDHAGNVRDKPILYMEDIDSSKTGIPAAGDLILGYGISRDLWNQKMACINIAKSKFKTHEHFYVRVNPDIDRLESA